MSSNDHDNRRRASSDGLHARSGRPSAPGRATRTARLPPSTAAVADAIQAKGDLDAPDVHATASRGVSGAATTLPHFDAIQRAFGHHDLAGVRAHIGGPAADASRELGARAYATGDQVAFAAAPDLRLAAHEAAHVVQQRGGVRLSGGVGRPGDEYEQNADAVADRVVRGESAQDLLDPFSHRGAGGGKAVMYWYDGDLAASSERESIQVEIRIWSQQGNAASIRRAIQALRQAQRRGGDDELVVVNIGTVRRIHRSDIERLIIYAQSAMPDRTGASAGRDGDARPASREDRERAESERQAIEGELRIWSELGNVANIRRAIQALRRAQRGTGEEEIVVVNIGTARRVLHDDLGPLITFAQSALRGDRGQPGREESAEREESVEREQSVERDTSSSASSQGRGSRAASNDADGELLLSRMRIGPSVSVDDKPVRLTSGARVSLISASPLGEHASGVPQYFVAARIVEPAPEGALIFSGGIPAPNQPGVTFGRVVLGRSAG